MKFASSFLALAVALCVTAPAAADTSTSSVTQTSTPTPVMMRPPAVLKKKKNYTADSPLNEVLAGKDKTGSAGLPPRKESPGSVVTVGEDDRERPDFDGRPAAKPDAGEVLIWVPRVLFFPVHLVFEYLVRWPLVGATTLIEEYYLIERVKWLFTFRDGKSGIYPSFFADFGIRPAIGFTTFHKDLPVTGNTFTLGVGWWGPRWINARARNTTTVLDDDSGRIDVFGSFVRRPDFVFYGIGSDTPHPILLNNEAGDRFRYQEQRAEAGLSFQAAFSGLNRLRVSTTFRDVNFGDNSQGDVALEDAGLEVIGFNDPGANLQDDGVGRYQLIDTRLEVKIDTRDPDREYKGGTGFLLEVFGSFSFDPSDPSRNFIRWGAESGVFYDFTKRGHVLALRVYGEFVEDTGGTPVPFTELASLGGNETMRGYLARRFVGDSVFEATLSYRYPVWSILDAEVFASLGNAFEGHWGIGDDLPNNRLDFDRLFLNGGFGLRTSLARDTAIQILFALGSTRLDSDDVKIDSVRFVFGLAEGF